MMDNTFANPTITADSQTLCFAEFVAVYFDDACIFSAT
jgi:hypothetical protein